MILTSFVEGTVLTPLCVFWHFGQRWTAYKSVNSLLATLLCSICVFGFYVGSMLLLIAITLHEFEERKYNASSFVLLVQDYFGYLQSFLVLHEFYATSILRGGQ